MVASSVSGSVLAGPRSGSDTGGGFQFNKEHNGTKKHNRGGKLRALQRRTQTRTAHGEPGERTVSGEADREKRPSGKRGDFTSGDQAQGEPVHGDDWSVSRKLHSREVTI